MKAQTHQRLIGSSWGVFMASIWSIALGVALGAWQLMMMPVKIDEAAKPSDDPRTVVYRRGAEEPSSDWKEKIASLGLGQHPQRLTLTAGDINTFLKRAAAPAVEGTKVSLNVRLGIDELQMGAMIFVPWLKDPLVWQTAGGIAQRAQGPAFEPRRMTIGGLPLPGWLARPLIGAVLTKAFEKPEAAGMVASWRAIKQNTLRDNRWVMSWE